MVGNSFKPNHALYPRKGKKFTLHSMHYHKNSAKAAALELKRRYYQIRVKKLKEGYGVYRSNTPVYKFGKR